VSGNRRIKSQGKKTTGRIPTPQANGSTDHLEPVFRFRHAVENGSYSLHCCGGGTELEAVISCFKKIEQRTWQEIKATGGRNRRNRKSGLGFTTLQASQLPDGGKILDEDVRDRVFEVRVTQIARLMCFRDANVCNVVWYDSDHSMT